MNRWRDTEHSNNQDACLTGCTERCVMAQGDGVYARASTLAFSASRYVTDADPTC